MPRMAIPYGQMQYPKKKNVRVAFEVLPNGKSVPIGHQFMQCHMVFDIKIEDFRHKARLVAEGHMTKKLASIVYARVISRETVRIAFLIATLNDLEVSLGNILNAYEQGGPLWIQSSVKIPLRLQ